MSNYLITLRPTGSYFFGGENTFGEDKSKQNYFVESNYYPQQTTLLGMLRYYLLQQNNLLPLNSKEKKLEAKNIIGPKSFMPETENEFGKIKQISPLFMTKTGDNNGHYYFAPKYTDTKLQKVEGCNSSGSEVFLLKNYNPKTYYPNVLRKNDDYGKSFCFDNVFVAQTAVGITKSKNREQENNAFYRQTTYSLASAWQFAFFANIDDDAFEAQNEIIKLGGEQSKFIMNIAKTSQTYEAVFDTNKNNGEAIVLMSDAFADTDLYEHCKFAVTETSDFRGIASVVDTTDNYGKSAGNLKGKAKFNLLKRGSLLYPQNTEALLEQLNRKDVQTAGFNQYKFL